MIELKSVSRHDADVINGQNTDTQETAQRMLVLLLDVLRPFESDLSGQDNSADIVHAEGDDTDSTRHRTTDLEDPTAEAAAPWKTQAEDPEGIRQQLKHLLDSPTETGAPAEERLASLQPVEAATEMETLQTWLTLSQISDRLGPAQLAGIERQTDLQALPGEVLQAIEMHLDDDRLSSFGKVLRIGHLLLGQGFPSQ